MDLKTLEAFVTLAQTLNFTEAAERLFISQSAISRQIGRLEDELDTELLLRNRREVELTPAGRVFLDDCREILQMYDRSLTHISDLKRGIRGNLAIGFLQDSPSDRFSAIIRTFRQQCPDIRLELREYGMSPVIEALITGKVDIAHTLNEGVVDLKDINCLPVADYPICAVVRSDDPLAAEKRVTLEQMAERELVLISPQQAEIGRQSAFRQFHAKGLVPRVAAYADIVPSLMVLIEAGIGIGTLPSSAQTMASDNIAFVPMEDDRETLSTVLAWRAGHANPCVETFIQVAREVLTP